MSFELWKFDGRDVGHSVGIQAMSFTLWRFVGRDVGYSVGNLGSEEFCVTIGKINVLYV